MTVTWTSSKEAHLLRIGLFLYTNGSFLNIENKTLCLRLFRLKGKKFLFQAASSILQVSSSEN